jgi:hypothetical protein
VLVVVPLGTVARLDKTAGVTTPNGRSRRHLFGFGRVAENTGPDIVNLRRCAASTFVSASDFAILIRLIRAMIKV